MLRAFVLTLALFLLLPLTASAQAGADKQSNDQNESQPHKSGEFGSPTEEMLSRAEIRHQEELHKEMVERSDEAAQLGEEILSSFKKNNTLTADDYKKLDRLEKLARKIRSGVGGSDDEEETQDLPGRVDAAVSRLADLSETLKKSVEKTSRFVISAAVIDKSNEMIELIRHIRSIKP